MQETIAQLLVRKRMELGLTQTDLAMKYGINQCGYSNWETGKALPTHKTVQARLLEVFNITEEEFTKAFEYSKHLKDTNSYELYYRQLQCELHNKAYRTTVPKSDFKILEKYFSIEDIIKITDKLHKLEEIQAILARGRCK